MKQFLAICSVLLITSCSSMGGGSDMHYSGTSSMTSSASGAPAPAFDPFLYSGGN
ncbi:MAG: hypothetical protein H7327_01890 [Herminiimonas sp.]|nr:hypothetical protein [Herminiimonas sp.]